jgi:exopolysaccharide biosynthesis polyprenyl glycosylphosphotransferase
MNVQTTTYPRSNPLAAQRHWRSDVPVRYAASALALAIDALVIVAMSVLTGTAFLSASRGQLGDIRVFAATGVMVSAVFCALVALQSSRDPLASATRLGRARMAAVAWIATFLFLVVLAFGMKISAQFSRGAIFSLFTAGIVLAVTSRVMTPRLLAHVMKGATYRGQEALIVAPVADAQAEAVAGELAQLGCGRIHHIAFDDRCSATAWPLERKRLLQSVFDTARTAAPGQIYLLGGKLPLETVSGLMAGLRILPRAVFLVPDEQISALLEYSVQGLGGVLALEMQKTPLTRTERVIKRAVDIAIAGLATIFLAPLLAAIAIAILSDSKGTILFRQNRHGYRGRPFNIYKFRTMTVMEDGDDIAQAKKDDQRITRVGRWLRKTSLDELPQLWNVLMGEMSIVGPRPHAAAHDALYTKLIENYEVRQHVKPGITGWAQVHGLRGETPNIDLMYRRIEMDIWYACNCTVALDVQILFKTVGAVIGQANAH